MENHSLYLKFNLLIVGTIFICGLLMGGMLLYTTRQSLEDGLDTSGEEVAASVGAVISNDILLDDRFSMFERLTHTMENNDQVRYIIVARPDGHILTSTFTNGLPVGLPAQRRPREGMGADTMAFESDEGYIREVMYPIDEGLVGYLRVGMSEKKMTRLMQERCAQIIILVFIICVAASLMATRYAWNFLQPIRTMSAAVRKLGGGDYGVKVPVETVDDIGQLGQAFNDMTDKLQMKDEENSRLLKELKEKEKLRIWLIGQLFSAREDERKRISRELHDETSQSMVSILAYLRILHDKLMTKEQRELLFEARNLTSTTLEGLRRLAVNLHPPMLDDLGLIVAIEKFLETFRRTQPQITVDMNISGDFSQLPHPISLICYRTLQEALTNIVRHAQADTVTVKLAAMEKEIHLSIRDNGIGFDRRTAEKARLNRHLGLVSMRERVELLNGRFHIDSGPSRGTCITIILPLEGIEAEREEHKDAGTIKDITRG